MDEAWDGWTVEDYRVFDGGEDQLASMFRIAGTGRSSGAAVERPVGVTYQLREGKLWRMRSYMHPPDALAAIGVDE
jgi:ketosteroid isomerase-like protein